MRRWDISRKNAVITVLTGVTLDSWRRQVLSDLQKAEAEDKLKAQTSTTNSGMDTQGLLKQDQEVKLEAMAHDTRDSFLTLDEAKKLVNKTKNKLDNNNFEQGETVEMVRKDYVYQELEASKAKEIAESKSRNLSNFIQDIRKSDTFDWIRELLDKYKEFIDSLDLDQKVAIMNLLGYYTLFNLSISIIIILGANHFIQLWNLDYKFPWLTKFLKIRAKVNSIYLKVYVLIYIVVFFSYIGLNLYILFSKKPLNA